MKILMASASFFAKISIPLRYSQNFLTLITRALSASASLERDGPTYFIWRLLNTKYEIRDTKRLLVHRRFVDVKNQN